MVAVVGAVESEVAQGGELGLNPVQPRAVGGGVSDLDVARRRPVPDSAVLTSLDPTGRGRAKWMIRWKAPLNAFDLAFDGRLSAGRK
ncbi:hypothetical protein BL254_13270 [Protofrankia sp. BMG5.30]|nr:hypothetical protein BL254_13270 [Protofrankia sp. BMG5.30]